MYNDGFSETREKKMKRRRGGDSKGDNEDNGHGNNQARKKNYQWTKE